MDKKYLVDFAYQFKPKMWNGRLIPVEVAVESGWDTLIYDMCNEIDKILVSQQDRNNFSWTQIKEKFGVLRIYNQFTESTVSYQDIDTIVEKYERLSGRICEVCGAVGTLRAGGWLKVLCDEHSQGKPSFEFPSSSAVE